MATWTSVDVSVSIIVGAPITFELGRIWYNNPIAIAEGAAGAPRISPRAIHPGGAEIDGAFGDGDPAPTAHGFYEYEALTLTVAKTFPAFSFVRCNGDSSLANVITVSTASAAASAAGQIANALIGSSSVEGDTGTGFFSSAGGGSVGAGGGRSNGGGGPYGGTPGTDISQIHRFFSMRRGLLGGIAAAITGASPIAATLGGGCLFLIVHGDLDLTGGTINANGANGASNGNNSTGGGGGGMIVIICTGTITGGTFNAKGGDGATGGSSTGGGGGGGAVILVASAFAGTQTISVLGGNGPGAADNGGAGFSQSVTLTEAQINGLLLR